MSQTLPILLEKGEAIIRGKTIASIKAAFFDIDGTLVRADHSVSAATEAALRQLIAHGIHVGLASGRSLFAASDLLASLPLTGPHLLFSGALIVDKTVSEPIAIHSIPPSVALDLVTIATTYRRYIELYTQENVYIAAPHPYAAIHAEYLHRSPIITNLVALLHKAPVLKIGIMNDDKDLSTCPLSRYVSTNPALALGNAKGAAHPDITFASITSCDASRLAGFRTLLQHLNVSASEVLCFGDGEADLPFITHAGIGVAMGNSNDVVKAHAPIITKSVTDDGVAYLIELLCRNTSATY